MSLLADGRTLLQQVGAVVISADPVSAQLRPLSADRYPHRRSVSFPRPLRDDAVSGNGIVSDYNAFKFDRYSYIHILDNYEDPERVTVQL